jgi:hypothetical protein
LAAVAEWLLKPLRVLKRPYKSISAAVSRPSATESQLKTPKPWILFKSTTTRTGKISSVWRHDSKNISLTHDI